ncbi:MAG: hypothetical protein GY774_17565 [Planctomycetes bacterium]|nr:hypothetical protein [Planctomycetota bacterium]
MTVEYNSGMFGETKPISEALDEFVNACTAGTAKSLHTGTPEEIEVLKEKRSQEAEMQAIGDRLSDLEAKASTVIAIPTYAEVKRLLEGE